MRTEEKRGPPAANPGEEVSERRRQEEPSQEAYAERVRRRGLQEESAGAVRRRTITITAYLEGAPCGPILWMARMVGTQTGLRNAVLAPSY